MNQPIFVRMFGNSPKIRAFNYLLKSRGLDCSRQDIARNCRVSAAGLNLLWRDFVGLRIVIPTGEIGKAKLFKLNEENEAVQRLIDVYKTLLEQETENYFNKHAKMVAVA